MENISQQHAANVVDILCEAQTSRETKLQQYSNRKIDEDLKEDNDSDSPIYDAFYFQNGSQTILSMTNFSSREFDLLWNTLSTAISRKWNTGRGRRYTFKDKDVLFMTLTTMKHSKTWNFLGSLFKINANTFERLVLKFISCICIKAYNHFVDENDGRWHMKRIPRHEQRFKHFKFCRYATDVIFQQSYRPGGQISEGKNYYSAKHKLYGLKTKVSVLPNGQAINCTGHAPGGKPDIDIFYSNLDLHNVALKKRDDESLSHIIDAGDFLDKYADYWGVLLDKGYQGALEHVRAVHPKKRPPRGFLSIDEVEKNRKISSDRIIVENYFGRLTNLWNVIGSKYKWGEQYYDDIFMLCVALTNQHVLWHPLRAEDGNSYACIRNRLFALGEETTTKRKLAQKRYRDKRQRRMAAKLHEVGSDEDKINPNI